MIKVIVNPEKIIIKGHANYHEYGKDIVCASCSSIVITSINLALKIAENSLKYEEKPNMLTIDIVSKNETISLVIKNMLDMLEELSQTYPKNIQIKEERP